MDSPAMFLAVRAIADRVRVDVSTVLLGIYTVALARVTGNNPTVAQMLVSNRFRPGLSDIVSNVSQTGLCVVDVAGMTVDDAITATRRASMKTYKHAYFDLSQWKDLVARIARDRGGDIGLGYYYNDRPSQSQVPEVGVVPTADEIEAAIGEHRPTAVDRAAVLQRAADGDDQRRARPRSRCWCSATPTSCRRPRWKPVAREMESVAVAAALDPATRTDV